MSQSPSHASRNKALLESAVCLAFGLLVAFLVPAVSMWLTDSGFDWSHPLAVDIIGTIILALVVGLPLWGMFHLRKAFARKSDAITLGSMLLALVVDIFVAKLIWDTYKPSF